MTKHAERPPYVFMQRPRCPRCGSIRLLVYRSTANGDGSVTRHTRCEACGQRVFVVVEP